MQRAALVALLSVLTAAASVAATPSATLADVHFLPPARADGLVAGSGLTWAILVFSPGDQTSAVAQFPQAVTAAHFQDVVAGYTDPAGNEDQFAVPESPTTRELPPFVTNLAFPERIGSIYIEAHNITLEFRGVAEVKPLEGCLRATVGIPVFHGRAARYDRLCPAASAGVAATAAQFDFPVRLQAKGVAVVEWHGADTRCTGVNETECPDGGTRQDETTVVPGGWSFNSKVLGYNRMTTEGGVLDLEGTSNLAVAGGLVPSVAVDGSLRMPLAGSAPACAGCLSLDGQTLAVNGHSLLRSLQVSSGGDMRADLQGDFTSARLDEQAVNPVFFSSPSGIAVAATAAAGGLIAVVKWLLVPLFTRHKLEGPLANERRRRLYECVIDNPGIHFREALRQAGVPAGSGRHHVTKLVQAGLIVERRHGASVCLFENSSRFRDSWHDLAALRNPDLRQLHEWVSAHPATSQKDIMAAFQASHGWTRTIAQERIQRLVRDGLLFSKAEGRYKFYSAVKSPASVPFAPPQVVTAQI